MKPIMDFYRVTESVLGILNSNIISTFPTGLEKAFKLGHSEFRHQFIYKDDPDSPNTLYYSHKFVNEIVKRVLYWIHDKYFLKYINKELPDIYVMTDTIKDHSEKLILCRKVNKDSIEFFVNAITASLIYLSNKLNCSLTEGSIMSSVGYLQLSSLGIKDSELLNIMKEAYHRG